MSVILAAIIGGSLYFSVNGLLWATQIIIGILSLNIFLVAVSVSTFMGFQKTLLANPQKRLEELRLTEEKTDVSVLLLLRFFMLACAWHLYTIGYVFFAGIAVTTVTLSILIMTFRALDAVKAKEK